MKQCITTITTTVHPVGQKVTRGVCWGNMVVVPAAICDSSRAMPPPAMGSPSRRKRKLALSSNSDADSANPLNRLTPAPARVVVVRYDRRFVGAAKLQGKINVRTHNAVTGWRQLKGYHVDVSAAHSCLL